MMICFAAITAFCVLEAVLRRLILNPNAGGYSNTPLPAARYFRGPKVHKGLRFLKRKVPKN